MRHLKYFESVDIDDFDTDKIGKKIYQYVNEFGKGDRYVRLIPGALGFGEDFLKKTEAQYIKAVEQFVDSSSGRVIRDFIKKYEEMLQHGHLNINMEEIEDLFLDLPDYTIEKSESFDNKSIFNVLISINNIKDDELSKMSHHIYDSVKKRLPENLYIKRVTTLCDENGIYNIKIRLFERIKIESNISGKNKLINPYLLDAEDDENDGLIMGR